MTATQPILMHSARNHIPLACRWKRLHQHLAAGNRVAIAALGIGDPAAVG
jgi:hypothetical protein